MQVERSKKKLIEKNDRKQKRTSSLSLITSPSRMQTECCDSELFSSTTTSTTTSLTVSTAAIATTTVNISNQPTDLSLTNKKSVDFKKNLLNRYCNKDEVNLLNSSVESLKVTNHNNENKQEIVKKKRSPKSTQNSSSPSKPKTTKSKKKSTPSSSSSPLPQPLSLSELNDMSKNESLNIFDDPDPIFEEDLIDGFAILSFQTLEQLEFISNEKNVANNLKKVKSKPRKKLTTKTDKCTNKEKNIIGENQKPIFQHNNSFSNTDDSISLNDDINIDEFQNESSLKDDDSKIHLTQLNDNLESKTDVEINVNMSQEEIPQSIIECPREENDKSESIISLNKLSAEKIDTVPMQIDQEQSSIIEQRVPVITSTATTMLVNCKIEPLEEKSRTPSPQLQPQPIKITSNNSTLNISVTATDQIAPVSKLPISTASSLPRLHKDVNKKNESLNHMCSESPAIAAPGSQCPPYSSLYAPYTIRSPLTAPSPATAVVVTTAAGVPIASAAHSVVPHHHTSHHSPFNKDIYHHRNTMMNAVQPTALPPSTVSSQTAFSKNPAWSPAIAAAAAAAAVASRPTFGPPLMFATPTSVPPSAPTLPLGSNSFSGDQIFATNQATDVLRRELDSRFLANQDRSLNIAASPFLRADIHQHQHHHTHVHQHTTTNPLITPTIFPSSLMLKDVQKLCPVNTPFVQPDLGIATAYTSYPNPLVHPTLNPSTQFVAPTPQFPSSFQPKKRGRWNAMHVRIAWEIYYHQQKYPIDSKVTTSGTNLKIDMMRQQSQIVNDTSHHNIFHTGPPQQQQQPQVGTQQPLPLVSSAATNRIVTNHELPFSVAAAAALRQQYEAQNIPSSVSSSNGFLPSSAINNSVQANHSSFTRLNTAQNIPYPLVTPSSQNYLPPSQQQYHQSNLLSAQHHPNSLSVSQQTGGANDMINVWPTKVPQSQSRTTNTNPAAGGMIGQFGIYNGKQYVPLVNQHSIMGPPPPNNTVHLEQQRRELEDKQQRIAIARKEREEREEKHRKQLEKEKEKRLQQQQQEQQRYYESTLTHHNNIYRDRSPLKAHCSSNNHNLESYKKEDELLRQSVSVNSFINAHNVPLPFTPSSNPYLEANRSVAAARLILQQPTTSVPQNLPPPPPQPQSSSSVTHWPSSVDSNNPYRVIDPLRYNTLAMTEAYNQERAKLFGAYAAAVSSHPYGIKDQFLHTLRIPPISGPGPPQPTAAIVPSSSNAQLFKKDDLHR